MGKLFNLKEWLTVADAARHLSIVFGEDVTEADVLRLALDGRLRLSVYFVNHAIGRQAKWIPWEEYPELVELTEALAKMHGREYVRTTEENQKLVLRCGDEVTTLRGVWDLPMIGNEQLDIEHEYQNLTGGPAVTLQGLDGPFVEGRDDQIYQLQENYDENEYQTGSSAALERLNRHIAENNIEGTEAESLLNRHKEQRKEFLEKQRTRPAKENYYPAGGLPKDAVIVVRTEALREFERHGNDAPLPTSRDHVSDKLAKMNQAAAKFWGNADRNDRGTHTDNATVAAWLEKQGFSPTLADKAATIIRPEWVPAGRKPEE
ncbi:MAG TPA: hypothetical protein PK225_07870 [Azonexus sp.]|jgi:hypothetical protein|nr:hypothetical protein [Azonexus sp.]